MTEPFTPLTSEILRAHKGKSFTGLAITFMCHDGRGRFFMAQRSGASRDEPGVWDVGGGGLKFGETLVGGVRREVSEEYGATILKEPLYLGYRDVFRQAPDGTPTHWVTHDFFVLVAPDSMHINEPEMLSDSGWFTLDHLPSPRHSQMETLYWDKYRSQLQGLLEPAEVRG